MSAIARRPRPDLRAAARRPTARRRVVAGVLGTAVSVLLVTGAPPAGAAAPVPQRGLPAGTLGESALALGPGGSRQLLVRQVIRARKGRAEASQLWFTGQRGAARRWSTPVRVGRRTSGEASGLRLVDGRTGALVAVWVRQVGEASSLVASVRPAGATAWRTPTVLAAGGGTLVGSGDVSTAAAPAGDVTVQWSEQAADGSTAVHTRTYRAASAAWAPVVDAGPIDDAELAGAPSGEQVLTGLADGRYVTARRDDATSAWGAPSVLWDPAAALGSGAQVPFVLESPPSVTAAGDGTLVSAWAFANGATAGTGIDAANRLVVSVRGAGGTWGAPTVLASIPDLTFACRHQALVDYRGRSTVVGVLPGASPRTADVVAWTSAPGGAGPWARSLVAGGIERDDAFVASVRPADGRTVVLFQRPARAEGVARLYAVSRPGADGAWGRPALVTGKAARDAAGTTFSDGVFSESYGFGSVVGPGGVTIAAETAPRGLVTARLP